MTREERARALARDLDLAVAACRQVYGANRLAEILSRISHAEGVYHDGVPVVREDPMFPPRYLRPLLAAKRVGLLAVVASPELWHDLEAAGKRYEELKSTGMKRRRRVVGPSPRARAKRYGESVRTPRRRLRPE